ERAERLADHPRAGQRQDVGRADVAAVGVRASAAHRPLVDDRDGQAGPLQVVSAAQSDHPAAHHHDPLHGTDPPPLPQPNGSSSPSSSVASPVTYACPPTVGTTRSPSTRTVPRNTVPRMPSCRHTCPSRSLPSATRQASLALVPVPHGERSYALPGQRTKFRPWADGSRGGPTSSMWSISPPSAPVTPCRPSACRMRQVKFVRRSTFATSTSSPS